MTFARTLRLRYDGADAELPVPLTTLAEAKIAFALGPLSGCSGLIPDPLVPDLPAVTVRAVQHVDPPPGGQPGHVGQHVAVIFV